MKNALLSSFLILSLLVNSQDLKLQFPSNGSSLSQKSKTDIKNFLQFQNPRYINLVGFADYTGSKTYNEKLITKRLTSVQNYISKLNPSIKLYSVNTLTEGKSLNTRAVYLFESNSLRYHNSFKPMLKKTQVYSIDNSKDTTLICEEGTKITIPVKVFTSDKKIDYSAIRIEVQEYYKKSDMIKAVLTTMNLKGVMISGGMINIRAFSNNAELSVKKGKYLTYQFTGIEKESEMELFEGKEKEGVIQWMPNGRNLIDGEQLSVEVIEEDRSSDKRRVWVVVEDMPEFPGGPLALRKFLADNLVYPEEAKKQGLYGRVFVGFVIEPTGQVSNFRLLQGVHPLLDNEAINVVKKLPNFKPGTQRGKPVRVSYSVPVTFRPSDAGVELVNRDFSSSTNPKGATIRFAGELKDGSAEKGRIATYQQKSFKFSKLRWVNCDEYMRTEKYGLKRNIKLISGYNNVYSILIVKNHNVIMPPKYKFRGIYHFPYIPEDLEVDLLSIMQKDNKYKVYQVRLNKRQHVYIAKYIDVSLEQLLKIFKSYD